MSSVCLLASRSTGFASTTQGGEWPINPRDTIDTVNVTHALKDADSLLDHLEEELRDEDKRRDHHPLGGVNP